MKVSVIIPVYNVEAYLEQCLNSILQQTYQDFEIICINDGSTDNSLKILEQYAKNYPCLKYYTIENQGQANARNMGIEKASGEYISFVDSDDTLDERMLETLMEVIEDDKSDMVLCGLHRIFQDGCSMIEKKFQFDARIEEVAHETIHSYPKVITTISNAPFAKLIRKKVIVDNHIQFPVGYIYEDMVFTHVLLACGISFSTVNYPFYNYLVRKGSTMTSKQSKVTHMFTAFSMILDKYKALNQVNEFKAELDYLALYHVGVGTTYRMFRSKQFSFWEARRACKAYLEEIQCSKVNAYFKKKSLPERFFIKVFM